MTLASYDEFARTLEVLIEAGTLSLTHLIRVGTMPIGIAVPDDRFAYVANMGDDTISVIDIKRALSCVQFRPATTQTVRPLRLPDSLKAGDGWMV